MITQAIYFYTQKYKIIKLKKYNKCDLYDHIRNITTKTKYISHTNSKALIKFLNVHLEIFLFN